MTRKTITVLLVTLALVLVRLAEAQQAKKIPRMGYLAGASLCAIAACIETFRQALRELGYGKYKGTSLTGWNYLILRSVASR